ncbi:hypothetical protein N7495_001854, partial [Penicillium taxi]|uniref:uncharacterized protein n=1 Tax=Penicillium taxi TaxID=168475 RepID=UPI002545A888
SIHTYPSFYSILRFHYYLPSSKWGKYDIATRSSRPLIITDAYFADASRSDRPKKQTPEVIDSALAKVRLDRYGREKTCADIAGELWKAGLQKTKPTRKPGLTAKMRANQLAWCLEHRDWTLED